jgi:hypothetical protein
MLATVGCHGETRPAWLTPNLIVRTTYGVREVLRIDFSLLTTGLRRSIDLR